MKEEKAEFIKKFQKHQIKNTDEDFEKETKGKSNLNILSVQKKKRDNEDDIEDLEKEVKKDKKKRHKNK